MTRQELEHIIRAAADVTNEKELIIIGSQTILGQYPNAPEELPPEPIMCLNRSGIPEAVMSESCRNVALLDTSDRSGSTVETTAAR